MLSVSIFFLRSYTSSISSIFLRTRWLYKCCNTRLQLKVLGEQEVALFPHLFSWFPLRSQTRSCLPPTRIHPHTSRPALPFALQGSFGAAMMLCCSARVVVVVMAMAAVVTDADPTYGRPQPCYPRVQYVTKYKTKYREVSDGRLVKYWELNHTSWWPKYSVLQIPN